MDVEYFVRFLKGKWQVVRSKDGIVEAIDLPAIDDDGQGFYQIIVNGDNNYVWQGGETEGLHVEQMFKQEEAAEELDALEDDDDELNALEDKSCERSTKGLVMATSGTVTIFHILWIYLQIY